MLKLLEQFICSYYKMKHPLGDTAAQGGVELNTILSYSQ